MDNKEKIIEIMLKENDANNILKELTDNNLLNEFDFSNDCCKKNYIKEKDTLYKYIKYKVSNMDVIDSKYERSIVLRNNIKEIKESGVLDPDSKSKILQSIYNKLYKDCLKNEKLERIVTNKKHNICGDTMNSVSITLNKSIERLLKASEKNELEKIKNVIYDDADDILLRDIEYLREELNSFKISWGDFSTKYTTELYLNYEKNLRRRGISNFSLKKYLEGIGALELMEVYHTLGNFIIIPEGCNAPRGSSLKDYWDLTLLCIYNDYFEKEDKKYCIEKISGKKNIENIKRYKDYLDTFNTWETFIKANFLESFVEIEKDENGKYSYGKPKELWEGHFEGELLPTNIEQCIEYFNNSAEWIKERTTAMVNALNKIENKEIEIK